MPDRIQRIKRFAEMHAKARVKVGLSQEDMAMELGVAKKTIQNWEKGTSSPSFFQSLEWFRVLGLNPMPYYIDCIYPDVYTDVTTETPDDVIDKAFNQLINDIPTSGKRALLYLFYGKHGSSPNAVMQMMLAHLHTGMKGRALHASLIAQTYEMEKELDVLVCPENIQPNIPALEKAIDSAKQAYIKNQTSYYDIENEKEDAD